MSLCHELDPIHVLNQTPLLTLIASSPDTICVYNISQQAYSSIWVWVKRFLRPFCILLPIIHHCHILYPNLAAKQENGFRQIMYATYIWLLEAKLGISTVRCKLVFMGKDYILATEHAQSCPFGYSRCQLVAVQIERQP